VFAALRTVRAVPLRAVLVVLQEAKEPRVTMARRQRAIVFIRLLV
jgi:hypothetical protein